MPDCVEVRPGPGLKAAGFGLAAVSLEQLLEYSEDDTAARHFEVGLCLSGCAPR